MQHLRCKMQFLSYAVLLSGTEDKLCEGGH